MKQKSLIVSAIALVMLAIAGTAIYNYFTNNVGEDPASVEDALLRTATEMNKSLPMLVDTDTRLDATASESGKSFIYTYTLVKASKEAVNLAEFQNVMRPKIVSNYKSNDQMKYYREHNVELRYRYKDKNGEFLVEIAVSPRDF